MAIFITGDIHGSHSIRKLGRKKFDPVGLTRNDYVIILGDFGLIWRDPPAGDERYWLDWLEGSPGSPCSSTGTTRTTTCSRRCPPGNGTVGASTPCAITCCT